jgi:hypothetical protein
VITKISDQTLLAPGDLVVYLAAQEDLVVFLAAMKLNGNQILLFQR